jgi:hypothetical protein
MTISTPLVFERWGNGNGGIVARNQEAGIGKQAWT